jgi:hypothetical protein
MPAAVRQAGRSSSFSPDQKASIERTSACQGRRPLSGALANTHIYENELANRAELRARGYLRL